MITAESIRKMYSPVSVKPLTDFGINRSDKKHSEKTKQKVLAHYKKSGDIDIASCAHKVNREIVWKWIQEDANR